LSAGRIDSSPAEGRSRPGLRGDIERTGSSGVGVARGRPRRACRATRSIDGVCRRVVRVRYRATFGRGAAARGPCEPARGAAVGRRAAAGGRAVERAKHPSDSERPIALSGLSWIVNPYEDGGVVIAIEITLGAAVAGPFDIEQPELEAKIARVLSPSATIH